MVKIAIDAGHGRYTAGKRCLKSIDPNETREWVLNADIATKVCKLLESYHCQTKRMDDVSGSTDVSLSKRCSTANNWGADYYVSIHNDAGLLGSKGGGTTVFSLAETGNGAKLRNILYPTMIATANSKGNRSDGTRTANFYVLRNTSMPAILIECEFMDSADRTPLLLTASYREKLANGIVNGLVKGLNLTSNSATEVPLKNTNADGTDAEDQDIYKELQDIPVWYRDSVKQYVDAGAIAGTGDGLNLSDDICRLLTILNKTGIAPQ